MSDFQERGSQGSDVRALFQKARIGNSRYLTFAPDKSAEAVSRLSEPAKKPQESVGSLTAPTSSRRSLNSIDDASERLRMASATPRRVLGQGKTVAFVSCTGGAGKTTLCATLARALSARHNKVLVADTCPEGVIPFYFSLERQTAGGLQTAYPSASRAGYPIMLVAASDNTEVDASSAAWLRGLQADSSLTFIDLPTNQTSKTASGLEEASLAIVPLLADIQSVASLGRVEALAASLSGGKVVFLLNRYDDQRPLHREIRAHMETTLGDRLAPVAIRESELISEAMFLGKTVLDHAPQSDVAEEMERLASWLEEYLTCVDRASGEVGIA